MTAVLERDYRAAKVVLQTKHDEEFALLIVRQTAIMNSNIGAGNSANLAGIQAINANELRQWQALCVVEKAKLHTVSCWEFRKLIETQQLILASAAFPGVSGASVNSDVLAMQAQVVSIAHAAYLLRKKAGEVAHNTLMRELLAEQEEAVRSNESQQHPPAQQQQHPSLQQQQRFPPPPMYPNSYSLPPGLPPPPHMNY
jgi:hypothetical protein